MTSNFRARITGYSSSPLPAPTSPLPSPLPLSSATCLPCAHQFPATPAHASFPDSFPAAFPAASLACRLPSMSLEHRPTVKHPLGCHQARTNSRNSSSPVSALGSRFLPRFLPRRLPAVSPEPRPAVKLPLTRL
ncbi:hypothetical protein B0H17DRAFT_1198913 [Mycena rosella]|uniref:Uncharacterized protein n=1 Tax=Mycena rosella TaxID=1033263 RepID=A0AAD7DND1_MYCRO|nr:hypothetical protein B0H17DRAFT_1198913 [Mycena rosella]